VSPFITQNITMTTQKSVSVVHSPATSLTPEEFYRLRDLPPETDWFANIDNPNTQRAYKADMKEFMAFLGHDGIHNFREVTRIHVIAWRKDLENRQNAPATIRRKLAALSSLYDYLTECNSVLINPVDGIKRPKRESTEGKTPAISDAQARALLEVPNTKKLIGKRDKAILSVLLFHALRRDELCKLHLKSIHERRGVAHLEVHGKGGKIRNVPLHPLTHALIKDYLAHAPHGTDAQGALFRPIINNQTGDLKKSLSTDRILKIVKAYGLQIGITNMDRFAPHALRATAATNALENSADITKVQEWLGHANISTTRGYDRRESRAEDSPVWRVNYQ
jgi:integrase/recombinase XerD